MAGFLMRQGRAPTGSPARRGRIIGRRPESQYYPRPKVIIADHCRNCQSCNAGFIGDNRWWAGNRGKGESKYTSTLRQALDLLHSKDSADQKKGLKLNRDTQAQIKAALQDILASGQTSQQAAGYPGQTNVNRNNTSANGNGAGYVRPAGGACPCGQR